MTKQSFRMTTVTTAARICQMLSLLRRLVALPLSHSVPPYLYPSLSCLRLLPRLLFQSVSALCTPGVGWWV